MRSYVVGEQKEGEIKKVLEESSKEIKNIGTEPNREQKSLIYKHEILRRLDEAGQISEEYPFFEILTSDERERYNEGLSSDVPELYKKLSDEGCYDIDTVFKNTISDLKKRGLIREEFIREHIH